MQTLGNHPTEGQAQAEPLFKFVQLDKAFEDTIGFSVRNATTRILDNNLQHIRLGACLQRHATLNSELKGIVQQGVDNVNLTKTLEAVGEKKQQ